MPTLGKPTICAYCGKEYIYTVKEKQKHQNFVQSFVIENIIINFIQVFVNTVVKNFQGKD